MKFSQRIGKTEVRQISQKEEIDEVLKNNIWNILSLFFLRGINDRDWEDVSENDYNLCLNLWVNFFSERVDHYPKNGAEMHYRISYFFFRCNWYEIYDFIEFLIKNYRSDIGESDKISENLVNALNKVLEKEMSAYRIIDHNVTEITSNEEMSSIEESLQIADRYKPVKEHLKRALELFSDRKKPDYRNSIKESISSVEAIASIVTGTPKSTLGDALNKIDLHPALKKAFSNLYGYTSDADGIRHKLLDESTVKQEDAKFMLVSCSAFINYLVQKELSKK